MTKKLLLIFIACITLHATDNSPGSTLPPSSEVIQKRIDLAMNILSASFKDNSHTIHQIEEVEYELKQSDKELEKTKDISLKKKIKLGRRYLESARQALDKQEEKHNPSYYDVSSISDYTSRDYSFDTLIIAQYLKDKKKDKNPSKQAPEKTVPFYKLFLALLVMNLFLP